MAPADWGWGRSNQWRVRLILGAVWFICWLVILKKQIHLSVRSFFCFLAQSQHSEPHNITLFPLNFAPFFQQFGIYWTRQPDLDLGGPRTTKWLICIWAPFGNDLWYVWYSFAKESNFGTHLLFRLWSRHQPHKKQKNIVIFIPHLHRNK